MNRRRTRLIGIAALAALGASMASLAPSQAAPILGAQATAQVAAKAVPIDRSKAMSAADRAAIDAEATSFLSNSIDHTPGLWLAVWDPKRGYYEQAYGEARLAGVEALLSAGDRRGCGKVASALAWRDSETRQGPGAWAESAAGRIRGVCR